MVGKVIVHSIKEGTQGTMFDGPLASYPNRYAANLSFEQQSEAYEAWLINQMTEGDGSILAMMEDYATIVLRGGDLVLLFHYLMDEVYCLVIKKLIDQTVQEHSS